VPIYPFLRSALFRLDAEDAHHFAVGTLGGFEGIGRPVLRAIFDVEDPRLRSTVFGIDFPNPVGLAAGFDKDGKGFPGLSALGFGFIEIGTVTAHGQSGNPRPRLFRLPADRALLNRMGFNNPGAEEVSRTLAREPSRVVLGVNIGKSKVTPLEAALEDYLTSLELLHPFARYVVVNVSSPNTPGLRKLQEAEPLRQLLQGIVSRAKELRGPELPILVKLAPDLTDPQLDEAVEIALAAGVAGLVAVNTTISREGLRTPPDRVRELGDGGISGGPVRRRAQEVVSRIRGRTGGSVPIIGVGGIFSAEDAWRRIRAGADLVQVYTGFVYEGPSMVRRINTGLLRRLEREGFASIAEAVGTDP